MKMIRKILIPVLVVAMLMAFAGCAAPVEEKPPVTLDTVQVYGELVDNNYGEKDANAYQLKLFSDGTYEYTVTTVVNGYGMNLGTTTVITFGTFTKGSSVDGATAYTLSDATRVVLNSYSDMGGFNISIDTDTATYPVEMPAKTEGEKNMAQSAQDVIDNYGKSITVYFADGKNTFTLTDPNA